MNDDGGNRQPGDDGFTTRLQTRFDSGLLVQSNQPVPSTGHCD
jgi:hypothetical protein